jgi:hypothetical protein
LACSTVFLKSCTQDGESVERNIRKNHTVANASKFIGIGAEGFLLVFCAGAEGGYARGVANGDFLPSFGTAARTGCVAEAQIRNDQQYGKGENLLGDNPDFKSSAAAAAVIELLPAI